MFLFLMLGAALAQAAGKPPQAQLPPGMGRYILVLKLPDERRDTPKTITEPDVAKLGGKVVSKHDNRRVIELPSAAAKALRDNASVAYLQRVWMGESFDTWDERDLSTGSSSLKAHTDDTAGTNLTWDSGTFTYDPSGNVKGIGSDAYTYDTASRIVKAVVGGQSESYAYDSFGNLTQKTLTGQPPTIPAIDSTSNRVLGEAYDAAGNMTTSGSRTGYVYDSAGSLVQFNTSLGQSRRMIYTADDERIGEMLDSQLVRWKVRDFSTGQILREFQSEASPFSDVWEWTEDYVYAGSTVVGAETETYWGGKRHFHLDHLGSVRMITNDARMRYSRNDYYPFGTEQSSSVQEATNFGYWRSDPVKFTGHEREYYGILNVDNSDYLDNMHARFYNPNLGRFLSVDAVGGFPARPQSWNRYAYARNSPVVMVDRDGNLAFPWHVGITYAAARRAGMGVGGSLSLGFRTAWVDLRRHSQSGEARDTNMHAMAGRLPNGSRQTAAEARVGTAASIQGSLARGDVAAALHTTQDAATPLHKDHYWPGSYSGLGFRGALAHFFGDLFPSVSTIENAYGASATILDDQAGEAVNPAPRESFGTPQPEYDWNQLDRFSGLLSVYYVLPWDSPTNPDPFRNTGFCDASNTCH